MGTRNNPGQYDCLAKLGDDEPYFLLMARDRSAPAAVLAWAIDRLDAVKAGDRPSADLVQIAEALSATGDMVRWRARSAAPYPSVAGIEEVICTLEGAAAALL